MAIIYALRRFRCYLDGNKPFKIVTDCNSLTLTLNKSAINPRIARWALELEDYAGVVQHRSGVRMAHVDALSRCHNPPTLEREEINGGIIGRVRATMDPHDVPTIDDESMTSGDVTDRNGVSNLTN